jgi:mono/diheme cytochrome c family protein
MCLLAILSAAGQSAQPTPGFYRDVLPILEQHCQSCHRPGEIAPFAFVTYQDAKPWAQEILDSIKSRKMPPWFADPCCGHFSNDPSLSPEQLATIVEWVKAGAPAGDEKDAQPAPHWITGWNIAPPDRVLKMPRPVKIPADGDVEYT